MPTKQTSSELRQLELNGQAITGQEFDPRDLEAAKQQASETNGVLYTLFDDEATYDRGVFYVNCYGYVVFPLDLGAQFTTNANGEIQSAHETQLEALANGATHTWLMFDSSDAFIGLQDDIYSSTALESASDLNHDELIEEYEETAENHNELQKLLDVIREGGRLEYVTRDAGKASAVRLSQPKTA